MPVVYKLDRIDGLSYIGITTNFKKRLATHKRSNRFKDLQLVQHCILFEGNYTECEEKEAHFINLYDTYRNGLNVTPSGKGKNENCKFNTLGYKFSEETRKKMSQKAKSRTPHTGYKHSEETKAHWSRVRKGRIFAKIKLNPSDILAQFNDFEPSTADIDSIPTRLNKMGQRVFVNSKPYSYHAAKLLIFAKLKSRQYSVTVNAVKRVINHANSI